MHNNDIAKVVEILTREMALRKRPIVSALAEQEHNPFQILISTILSLRTKDEVTGEATKKLRALAATPEEMLKLSEEEIAAAIYPVGFYRNKAKTIRNLSQVLTERYHSRVPDTMEELLKLNGVGRKTANLVITLGYRGEGICVDTHVHRISNRLGYVITKTPEETEFALRDKLPRVYWTMYNTLMVAFGQTICKPLSPLCSQCPVRQYCARAGVTRSR